MEEKELEKKAVDDLSKSMEQLVREPLMPILDLAALYSSELTTGNSFSGEYE